MRSAAGLALLAAGAILTVAVTAQVPGINLRAAGVILIITGIVALIPPARIAALLHRGAPAAQEPTAPPAAAAGEPDESVYPAYLLQDPAVLAAEVLNGARAARTGASASPRALRSVGQDGQDGDA
jgi:hypothetical protein